jgi:predicted secreted protein
MVLCILVATPASLWAGDFSTLDFIGFSKDGKYLAFEEYGTADAAGYPYASVFFVDVEKNAFVSKPFEVVIENESATEAAAIKRVEAQAARRMRALKIVRGNTGKLLLAHFLTDKTYTALTGNSDDAAPQKVRFELDAYPDGQEDFYELALKQIEVKPQGCDDDSGVYKFYLLDLKLDYFYAKVKSEPTLVLQKDDALPVRRGCPLGYRIERVYQYKDKIAVFLNVYYRGFEGPDLRYMVVTGNLQ